MDENRISQLIDIFSELSDVSGGLERTSIFPNLEVIDDSPADLSSQYIIIQDNEGFYVPALKVPGLTYNVGDKVNVLFIKGTEPIAFQQGVNSTNSNSGITVRKNSGANVGTRPRLNLIEGTNVTMTIADDSGGNEIDITINSSGTGGSADIITIRTFN